MASKKVPPVLYKYYSPKRISVVTDWTVHFSRPGDFNDTFDSNWPATGKDERMERFHFRSRTGIFCLTEKPDNHLMWVHYADQHRGFVIGYKTSAAFLQTDGRRLDYVRYRKPQNTPFTNLIDHCFYKGTEWRYEKEWRCARTIPRGEPFDEVFDPNDVEEIIIGAQMENADINLILGFADAVNSPGPGEMAQHTIQIKAAKPDINSRKILINPSTLALCGQCSGHGHINR